MAHQTATLVRLFDDTVQLDHRTFERGHLHKGWRWSPTPDAMAIESTDVTAFLLGVLAATLHQGPLQHLHYQEHCGDALLARMRETTPFLANTTAAQHTILMRQLRESWSLRPNAIFGGTYIVATPCLWDHLRSIAADPQIGPFFQAGFDTITAAPPAS